MIFVLIKVVKFVITILFLFSLLTAEKGYNTIYLMEFENLKNDFTNTHLKYALPDLIKENYNFREDIKVEYAGDIRPYLEPKVWSDEGEIKGLIINGRFQTINDDFFVEFEAYDIHNWKQLVKRQIFCPVHDIICLHDAFLIAIEKNISPFLADDLDISATMESLQKKSKKKEGFENYDLDGGEDTVDMGQLADLGRPKALEGGKGKQGQYGNRHYREFNLKDISPDSYSALQRNTDNLMDILDRILNNPYDVRIGDITAKPDSYNSEIVRGEIPIEYSLRSSLAEDMLSNLPHEKFSDKSGNIVLQFTNNDFHFDETLKEKVALMQYQVLPVIFFNNRIGGVQFIILDSWSEKYQGLETKNITMLHKNQFKPLYALTPGNDNIQLNLDVSAQNVVYKFSIPYEQIGDYTKVTVKFMRETDLDTFLKGQSPGR